MNSVFHSLKFRAEKHPEHVVSNAVLTYFEVTADDIGSHSLAGKLRRARELLFYLMYVHTDISIPTMCTQYRISRMAIRSYMLSCDKRLKDKNDIASTYKSEIFSLINTYKND